MRMRGVAVAALAAGVLTAAVVGGCGSDEKTDPAASGPKVPSVTTGAPATSTASTTSASTTTPGNPAGTPTTPPGPGNGGTGAPAGGGTGSGGTPAGSGGNPADPGAGAQSNYERYCASHPGACGD